MRISLLCIGKTDVAWVRQGLELYSSRLKHYVNFDLIELPELKNVSALSKEQIKQKEGEAALKLIKEADQLILLDEKGRKYRSVQFAAMLEEKLAHSSQNVVFVIGGAYGFSPQMYERANGKLSLSDMTFSHQMVRVIFTEQLYRAFTIIKGEPYHHE